MRYLTLFLILAALLTAGCTDRPDPEPSEAPEPVEAPPPRMRPLDEWTDDEKLMLIEEVPLGTSYEAVAGQIPTLSALQPEGGSGILGEQGLYDAAARTSVLGHDALIEFNFEHEDLYSYTYTLRDLECETAANLYAQLQEFYALRFGAYSEEQQAEGAYRSTSSYWRGAPPHLTLTNTFYGEACTLSWGFQNEQP